MELVIFVPLAGAALCVAMLMFGLKTGSMLERFSKTVYRDEEPLAFWIDMTAWAVGLVLCLVTFVLMLIDPTTTSNG